VSHTKKNPVRGRYELLNFLTGKDASFRDVPGNDPSRRAVSSTNALSENTFFYQEIAF